MELFIVGSLSLVAVFLSIAAVLWVFLNGDNDD
jgi:nitrogen fixation-related uncharacterized protein